MPRVLGCHGVKVESLSAEHGVLKLDGDAAQLQIGDCLEIVPGYSDLTTVLHERFHAFRGDRLEQLWPTR